MKERKYSAPKHFTVNGVEEFLNTFENVFNWSNKRIPNIVIDLSTIVNISIVGHLLIYKFMDFTYSNNCFNKPILNRAIIIIESWKKYGFHDLINEFISNKDSTEKTYRKFQVKVDSRFIIAPQALLRNTNYTKSFLKAEFYPKISEYYSFNPKIKDLIFTCFSEILLNFWEHAVIDTKSIIVADGSKTKVEIACADTGIGIISSLLPHFQYLSNQKEKLILKAFEKGVTSKSNTYHMGYGLWIVNELINLNQSKLHLYSQGYYYKNDFGKITTGKCGYWPGTIIYLNLDIKNPKSISDIVNLKYQKDLKINFS